MREKSILPYRKPPTFPVSLTVDCRNSWSRWICWRLAYSVRSNGYCTYEGHIGRRGKVLALLLRSAGIPVALFRDRVRDKGALRKGFGRVRSESTSWLLEGDRGCRFQRTWSLPSRNAEQSFLSNSTLSYLLVDCPFLLTENRPQHAAEK